MFRRLYSVSHDGDISFDESALEVLQALEGGVRAVAVVPAPLSSQSANACTNENALNAQHLALECMTRNTSSDATTLSRQRYTETTVSFCIANGQPHPQVVLDIDIPEGSPPFSMSRAFALLCMVCSNVVVCPNHSSETDSDADDGTSDEEVENDLSVGHGDMSVPQINVSNVSNLSNLSNNTSRQSSPGGRRRSSGWAVANEALQLRHNRSGSLLPYDATANTTPVSSVPTSPTRGNNRARRASVQSTCSVCRTQTAPSLGVFYKKGFVCRGCEPAKRRRAEKGRRAKVFGSHGARLRSGVASEVRAFCEQCAADLSAMRSSAHNEADKMLPMPRLSWLFSETEVPLAFSLERVLSDGVGNAAADTAFAATRTEFLALFPYFESIPLQSLRSRVLAPLAPKALTSNHNTTSVVSAADVVAVLRRVAGELSAGGRPALSLPWRVVAERECEGLQILDGAGGGGRDAVWLSLVERAMRVGGVLRPLLPRLRGEVRTAEANQMHTILTENADLQTTLRHSFAQRLQTSLSSFGCTATEAAPHDWQAWARNVKDTAAHLIVSSTSSSAAFFRFLGYRGEEDTSLPLILQPAELVEAFSVTLKMCGTYHGAKMRQTQTLGRREETVVPPTTPPQSTTQFEETLRRERAKVQRETRLECEGLAKQRIRDSFAELSLASDAVRVRCKTDIEAKETEIAALRCEVLTLRDAHSEVEAGQRMYAANNAVLSEDVASLTQEVARLEENLLSAKSSSTKLQEQLRDAELRMQQDLRVAATFSSDSHLQTAASTSLLQSNATTTSHSAPAAAELDRTVSLLEKIDTLNFNIRSTSPAEALFDGSGSTLVKLQSPEAQDRYVHDAAFVKVRDKRIKAQKDVIEGLQQENARLRQSMASRGEGAPREQNTNAHNTSFFSNVTQDDFLQRILHTPDQEQYLANFSLFDDATLASLNNADDIQNDSAAAALRQQLNGLRSELRALRLECAAGVQSLNDATTDVSRLESALQQSEAACEALRSTLKEAQLLGTGLMQENSVLVDEASDLRIAMQLAQTEQRQGEAKCAESVAHMEQLRAQLRATASTTSSSSSPHETKRLLTKIDDQTSAAASLKQRNQALELALESEQSARHEDAVVLRQRIQQAQETEKVHERDAEELRQRQRVLDSEMAEAAVVAQGVEAALKRKEAELVERVELHTALLRRAASLEDELHKAQTQTALLTQQVAHLEGECVTAAASSRALKAQHEASSAENAALQRRLSAKARSLDDERTDLDMQALRRDKEQAYELEMQRAKVAELSAQLLQQTSRLEVSEASLEQKSEELNSLALDVQELRQQAVLDGEEILGLQQQQQQQHVGNNVTTSSNISNTGSAPPREESSATASLRLQLDRAAEERRALCAHVTALQEECVQLKVELAKRRQSKVYRDEQQDRNMRDHQSTAEVTKADAAAEVSQLHSHITSLQDALHKAEAEHEAAVVDLEARCAAVEERNKTVARERAALATELSAARHEVETLRTQQQRTADDDAKRHADVDEQTARKVAALEERISGLEAACRSADVRRQAAEQRIVQLSREVDAMRAEVANSEQHAEDCERRLRTASEETKALRERLHTVQERGEVERRRLRDAKHTLVQADLQLNRDALERQARMRSKSPQDPAGQIAEQRALLARNKQLLADLPSEATRGLDDSIQD